MHSLNAFTRKHTCALIYMFLRVHIQYYYTIMHTYITQLCIHLYEGTLLHTHTYAYVDIHVRMLFDSVTRHCCSATSLSQHRHNMGYCSQSTHADDRKHKIKIKIQEKVI